MTLIILDEYRKSYKPHKKKMTIQDIQERLRSTLKALLKAKLQMKEKSVMKEKKKPPLKKSKPEKKPSPNEQLASQMKKVMSSELWKLKSPNY